MLKNLIMFFFHHSASRPVSCYCVSQVRPPLIFSDLVKFFWGGGWGSVSVSGIGLYIDVGQFLIGA